MFKITDRRVVQLDRIYKTYQDSIDLGIPPKVRYALTLFLLSFLCAAVGAHIATMFGANGVMVPLSPFLVAAMVGVWRYVTFPYKTWDDILGSMLNVYEPSDKAAFSLFETRVGSHGFLDEDVIDWVRAEMTALKNAEHAARARAIVERIVND